MKCNVCHNEFGNGEYCQNCKADKVVGLGSYTGYNAPHIQHNLPHQSPQQRTTQIVDSNMTICYKCANPIPANVDFCPACGLKLTTMCPKCGNKFSSQYAFCSSCGVNIEEFIAEQKRKEATEQALRIAEQKRRDAAILAEQQRQAELQRIAEAQKREELRKRAIAMQQPEFVDALAYIKKLLGKAEKKDKRYSIYATLLAFCVGWCIPGWVVMAFNEDLAKELDNMLALIGLIPGLLLSSYALHEIKKSGSPYMLKEMINSKKYIARNQIANARTKKLVEESIQLVEYEKISSLSKETNLVDIMLEAYFKISESSK